MRENDGDCLYSLLRAFPSASRVELRRTIFQLILKAHKITVECDLIVNDSPLSYIPIIPGLKFRTNFNR